MIRHTVVHPFVLLSATPVRGEGYCKTADNYGPLLHPERRHKLDMPKGEKPPTGSWVPSLGGIINSIWSAGAIRPIACSKLPTSPIRPASSP